MVDILDLIKRITELEQENTRLSEENDRLTAMLIYADARINKMVKEMKKLIRPPLR
jgi:phage host-nuclease inhibitor protein Gam